jgi:D-alanyl-D-alanine carboxypeptidase
VHNTNTLLGHNGFVGVKTGSTAAAGGCFAFRAIRWIDGKRTTITGVVLGQPGNDQSAAGLTAAAAMIDRMTGHRALPDLPQRTLAPGTAPRGHRLRLHARRLPDKGSPALERERPNRSARAALGQQTPEVLPLNHAAPVRVEAETPHE